MLSGGPQSSIDRPKESLEDFVAPLLLPELPVQLLASLLHFFVRITAAPTAVGDSSLSATPKLISDEQQQQVPRGDAISWVSEKRKPLAPGALRARLLLQHSPSFTSALVFLLMVRLAPQDCLLLNRTVSDPREEAAYSVAAFRDVLLLLHCVFLSDIRSSSKLKQEADAIRGALSNWAAVLEPSTHSQKQPPEQQVLEPLLHAVKPLLLGAIGALSALV